MILDKRQKVVFIHQKPLYDCMYNVAATIDAIVWGERLVPPRIAPSNHIKHTEMKPTKSAYLTCSRRIRRKKRINKNRRESLGDFRRNGGGPNKFGKGVVVLVRCTVWFRGTSHPIYTQALSSSTLLKNLQVSHNSLKPVCT